MKFNNYGGLYCGPQLTDEQIEKRMRDSERRYQIDMLKRWVAFELIPFVICVIFVSCFVFGLFVLPATLLGAAA